MFIKTASEAVLFPVRISRGPAGWLLDTPAAAHFLSVIGLLFGVWLECALYRQGNSSGLFRGDRVEQEADGELNHRSDPGEEVG